MQGAVLSDVELLDTMGDLVVPGYQGTLSSLNDVDIMGQPGNDTALVLEALQDAGIPTTPNQVQRVAQAMRTARGIDPNALFVRQQQLKNLGYQSVGIPATTFPIAVPVQTINLTVTRPFKPYELLVPSELAPYFVLLSAEINGRNQLASSNPVPMSTYSEASLRSKFRWETVNTSSPLVLRVEMIDVTAQRVLYMRFDGAAIMK